MYADDTTLVSHLENFGATNNAIEDGVNQEISKVSQIKVYAIFKHH